MIGLGLKWLKRNGPDWDQMLTGTLGERATLSVVDSGLLLATPEIVSPFLTVSCEGALASRVSLLLCLSVLTTSADQWDSRAAAGLVVNRQSHACKQRF